MESENKVHIWELPEKTDEIDKDNTYTLVHDGSEPKKVLITKLYEYFNQDYKTENIALFFETLLNNYESEYDESYDKLSESIFSYAEKVKKLSEDFIANKDGIRDLQYKTNKISTDIEAIIKSFNDINNIHFDLDKDIHDLKRDFSSLEGRYYTVGNNIACQEPIISSIKLDKSKIKSDTSYVARNVGEISEDIETQIEEKGTELIKNINDAYDSIVAIIDHYHHIHE